MWDQGFEPWLPRPQRGVLTTIRIPQGQRLDHRHRAPWQPLLLLLLLVASSRLAGALVLARQPRGPSCGTLEQGTSSQLLGGAALS